MASGCYVECKYCEGHFASKSHLDRHLKKCKSIVRLCRLCGVSDCSIVECKSEDHDLVTPPDVVRASVDALGFFNNR
jgi:hypothetical protein